MLIAHPTTYRTAVRCCLLPIEATGSPQLKETSMNGSFLRFYVLEKQHVHHLPVWEWLLERANKMGVRGGSAFRAIAGFGRHHTMREAHFVELAGLQPIEVEFIVTDEEARRLLDLIRKEGLRVFYSRTPAHFGVINPDAGDPPEATGEV